MSGPSGEDKKAGVRRFLLFFLGKTEVPSVVKLSAPKVPHPFFSLFSSISYAGHIGVI